HIPNSSFFFQAEDGIRDFHVTGVQTCALPISSNTMKIKKITLAIPAAAPAIPPKPSTAAISAMTKNVNAQPNILCSLVLDAQIVRKRCNNFSQSRARLNLFCNLLYLKDIYLMCLRWLLTGDDRSREKVTGKPVTFS